jgi:hypothetical protein
VTLGSEWRSGDEEHLLLADPAREGPIDLLEHLAHTYEARDQPLANPLVFTDPGGDPAMAIRSSGAAPAAVGR